MQRRHLLKAMEENPNFAGWYMLGMIVLAALGFGMLIFTAVMKK